MADLGRVLAFALPVRPGQHLFRAGEVALDETGGQAADLRRRAGATAGSTTSALAQRLIDEGLRMADHPGVIFKDGPSGRRAALAYGPDIREIIKFLREVDERGPATLDAAAEVFAVDASRIATAVSYYGDYQDEIDTEISEADEASARAEEAWRVQRQLIA